MLPDVSVLDLGRGEAAAWCARILAQLGARVEPPASEPDPARAEVVLTDTPALRPTPRPGVLVSITPFGLSGPYVDAAPPPDATAAGLLGFPPPVASALAGAHAAVAALAALRWARHLRTSICVEVAVQEVVAACLGDLLPPAVCPRAIADGRPAEAGPGSDGADHPRAASAARRISVLRCADGYVGLSAPTPLDRASLAALSGVDAVRDPLADLGALLGPWLRARTRAEIFHAAQLWRLPVVPVLEPGEALADEQALARGAWSRDACGRPWPRPPFRVAAPNGDPRALVPSPRRPIAPSPLADLRVLDLGMVWAGPYCARLLASLGARVIKVESPTRHDGTRPTDPRGCWGLFGDLNRGKAALALDLSTRAGRDLFLRLAARADVSIENFSPRVMPNFGLDPAALSAANPRLLSLSLPAFGSDGPWAHYVAYGSGLELATGLALATPDGRPAAAPVPYLDFLAGCYGAAALLAALLARDAGAGGIHLEVAQREVACQLLAHARLPARCWPAWQVAGAAAQAVSDPHLRARGLLADPAAQPPPGRACHHLARPPWRLRRVADDVRPAAPRRERAAPAFGADSRRLLRQLGLSADAVEALARAQVVGFPVAARPRGVGARVARAGGSA